MAKIYYLFGILLYAYFTSSKPNGSPKDSCFYMTPRHIHPHTYRKVFPTKPMGLYNITTSADVFRPDRPIRVTLWGPPFKGFMMVAAEEGAKDWPAGIFYSEDGMAKRMDCLGRGDTVTHLNNSYKDSVSVLWYGPENMMSEQIQFIATVVVNLTIYYTNIRSGFVRLDPSIHGAPAAGGEGAPVAVTMDPWLAGSSVTQAPTNWWNQGGRGSSGSSWGGAGGSGGAGSSWGSSLSGTGSSSWGRDRGSGSPVWTEGSSGSSGSTWGNGGDWQQWGQGSLTSSSWSADTSQGGNNQWGSGSSNSWGGSGSDGSSSSWGGSGGNGGSWGSDGGSWGSNGGSNSWGGSGGSGSWGSSSNSNSWGNSGGTKADTWNTTPSTNGGFDIKNISNPAKPSNGKKIWSWSSGKVTTTVRPPQSTESNSGGMWGNSGLAGAIGNLASSGFGGRLGNTGMGGEMGNFGGMMGGSNMGGNNIGGNDVGGSTGTGSQWSVSSLLDLIRKLGFGPQPRGVAPIPSK